MRGHEGWRYLLFCLDQQFVGWRGGDDRGAGWTTVETAFSRTIFNYLPSNEAEVITI
jgi:hypothetical protein